MFHDQWAASRFIRSTSRATSCRAGRSRPAPSAKPAATLPRSGAAVVRHAVAGGAEGEAGTAARRGAAFAAAHRPQVDVTAEGGARRVRNGGAHNVARSD